MILHLWVVAMLGTPSSFDVAELGERMRPAVVMLISRDLSGETVGTGTGFFITDDGLVATNEHVVKGAKDMVAQFHDGREVPVRGVLADSAEHDLAILKIDGGPWPALELGDVSAVKPGDRVAVLGHPLGLGWTLSDGIIAAIRENGLAGSTVKGAPDGPLMQFTAAATFGSSGSPIVGADGRVIAVVQSGVSEAGLRLGVSAASLRKLIDEARAGEVKPFGGTVALNLAISVGVFLSALALWIWFNPKRRKLRALKRELKRYGSR